MNRKSRQTLPFRTMGWFAFLLAVLSVFQAIATGVPHHLSGIGLGSNGTVTIRLDGSVTNLFALPSSVLTQFRQMFDFYLVDASPDLARWTRQAALLRTIGDSAPFYWQDNDVASQVARFYRMPTNYLITAFPKPTGPYPVGKITRILTDPARTNRYNIPTNSSFMCTIWYPASPAEAGTLPAPYADAAVVGIDDGNSFGWPAQWVNVMTNCVTAAYMNVPVAPGTNRFPVIVYSHGGGTERTVNSQITIELASHGYVVASVDHIDAHCTVFPDTRGVVYPPPVEVTATLVRSRTNDIRSLLTALAQFNSSDAVLGGRLDLGRIGAMGWSLGGTTVAEFTRVDARISCAVLLDPAIDSTWVPELQSVGLQKPFLTMSDTLPNPSFLPTTSQFRSWSSNLFYLAETNAAWFQVANANHPNFSDWSWSMNGGPNTRGASLAIAAGTLWLFDEYLKNQAPIFPTNAEILNLRRK